MEHITDANGKKISVSYFGNLQEKIDTATGYIQMYNGMVEKKNNEEGYLKYPMMNLEVAIDKIVKQHNRFYGMDSKYNGKGELRK